MLNRLDISDSDEWDTSSRKQIKEIYEASESKKNSRKRKSTKVEQYLDIYDYKYCFKGGCFQHLLLLVLPIFLKPYL